MVIPCVTMESARPSPAMKFSYDCAWMSMNPGVTASPRASMRLRRRRGGQRTARRDAGDPVAADPDVAPEPGVSAAVHDAAVRDHDVVRGAGRRDSGRDRRAARRDRGRGKNGNDGCELAHDAHPRRYCSSVRTTHPCPNEERNPRRRNRHPRARHARRARERRAPSGGDVGRRVHRTRAGRDPPRGTEARRRVGGRVRAGRDAARLRVRPHRNEGRTARPLVRHAGRAARTRREGTSARR